MTSLRFRFFPSSLLIFLSVFFAQSVHAVILQPAIVDISLRAGETTSTRLFVALDESGVGEYKARVIPFRPAQDGRSVEWLSETVPTPITVTPNAFRLLEGEAKALDIQIQTHDESLSANAFYGVVIMPVISSTTAISGRVASLFFLSSPEKTKPEFFVTAFSMQETYSSKFSSMRTAHVTIKNIGTGYGIPEANIVTRNVFGRIMAIRPLNPLRVRVLADGSREFDVAWESTAFGKYTTTIEGGVRGDFGISWWVLPTGVWVAFMILLGAFMMFAVKRKRL